MNTIKNTKKDPEDELVKDIIFLIKKKTISKKRPKKYIKVLLKKKKKKGISIIRNVSRSYLNMEEIIIYCIKKKN